MNHKSTLISRTMAVIVLVSLCAVCVSTNVCANPIPANTSPSVVMPNDETYQYILDGATYMFLFVKGYDGALWYNRATLGVSNSTWGWGGWQPLGGVLTSSPAATASDSSVVSVYVRGTNGALYERSTTNNGASWSSWVSLGGQIASGTGPGACSWGAGRLDVFVEGTNGALYHKWSSNSGATWSSWQSLGGVLTSSPGAASRGIGLIDVHVRGTNGADYYRSYYAGTWHSWVNLGGVIASGSGPAVSVWQYNMASSARGSQPADREDVFVMGSDGAMYNRTWLTISGWSPNWVNQGGNLTSSPTAAMYGNAIEIWARFTSGYLMLKEYYDGTWDHGQHGIGPDGWMGGTMEGPPGVF